MIHMKKNWIKVGCYLCCLSAFWACNSEEDQGLQAHLAEIAEAHDIMGGVVVLFDEAEQLEVVPFGQADLDRDIPVTDSTKFRIASISKPIATIAAMQLVEQGLLDLDSDVSTYLGFELKNPNFPDSAITPRMLMSHTSTINDGPTYIDFLGASYSDNPIPPISALLASDGTFYTVEQFTDAAPGTYFNYANINFGILGTIIEKISGERFDHYVRNHILLPLGIDGSFNINQIENLDNVSILYRKFEGVWTPQVDDYNGVQPEFENLESYTIGSNGVRFGPQGGLRVSAPQLATLFQLFLNDGTVNGVQILSPASIQQMMSPQWTYDGANGDNYHDLFNSWGLSLHISTNSPNQDVVLDDFPPVIGHTGEAYGLLSAAFVSKENNLGFVYMINGSGIGFSNDYAHSSFYTVEKAIYDAANDALKAYLNQ